MELKGNNFTLREWREEDLQSMTLNANNVNVWNNMRDLFPHPYSIADAQNFFEEVKGRPFQQEFVVEVDGQAVGSMGFYPQGNDVERFSAEIGYFLGEAYWGRGIMSAAVKMLVEEYIFKYTDIVRVFTAVFDYNIGSQRVLEKAGFTRVGRLRKSAFKNGRFIDKIAFEKVKD